MHPRFNAGDRRRLQQALNRTRAARHFRRLQAVLWVAEGRAISEAARLSHVSRASVHAWCRAYAQRPPRTNRAGLLAEKPRSGRPRRPVSRLPNEVLNAVLRQRPGVFGYQSPGWTLALLATHLQGLCGGQRPSASTLRRRLHALGWRWKRPRYVFLHPDPQRAKKNALC